MGSNHVAVTYTVLFFIECEAVFKENDDVWKQLGDKQEGNFDHHP